MLLFAAAVPALLKPTLAALRTELVAPFNPVNKAFSRAIAEARFLASISTSVSTNFSNLASGLSPGLMPVCLPLNQASIWSNKALRRARKLVGAALAVLAVVAKVEPVMPCRSLLTPSWARPIAANLLRCDKRSALWLVLPDVESWVLGGVLANTNKKSYNS